MTTNNAEHAAATTRGITVFGDDHAWVSVPATAYTRATSPAVTATAPGTSRAWRRSSARVSTRTMRAATSVAAATGMLT